MQWLVSLVVSLARFSRDHWLLMTLVWYLILGGGSGLLKISFRRDNIESDNTSGVQK